jgi:hypothetical protein
MTGQVVSDELERILNKKKYYDLIEVHTWHMPGRSNENH